MLYLFGVTLRIKKLRRLILSAPFYKKDSIKNSEYTTEVMNLVVNKYENKFCNEIIFSKKKNSLLIKITTQPSQLVTNSFTCCLPSRLPSCQSR